MPIDMPSKEPHSNQAASTPITVPPRRNDTDLTASPVATAEIDDVLLVGGEVASSSTAADEVGGVRVAGGEPKRASKALTDTSRRTSRHIRDAVEGREQTCAGNN